MAAVFVRYGAGAGDYKNTIINTLKKQALLTQVNSIVNTLATTGGMKVSLEVFCEAEVDEQWLMWVRNLSSVGYGMQLIMQPARY